jgi:hypothetical protein
MRTRWGLVSLWICFLLRGCFYASMFPLWEGYDEFAHFGVIRAISAQGLILPPRDQPGPRDVEESLKLAPVPWEVRGWNVFQQSLTDEQYWSLPPDERRARETRLRELPRAWARENSTAGISAYEALQPPLYYWLMAAVLSILKGASLPAQVTILRWLAILIASFAVPLTFAICQEGFASEALALGCAAVIAVMPEFASNAARISNEPLSILLYSLLIWTGLRIVRTELTIRRAAVLGLVLGLGLLTKAYFLTAVPAVLGLALYKRSRTWMPLLTTFTAAAAVAGWWYIRNIVTTGTLSGLAESVTLHNRGATSMITAATQVPWLRAVDSILVSHLYFCGWSSLTVRSWMYHVFFAIAAAAAIGLIPRLRQPAVLWLASIYGFFWLGQLYNVMLQYLTKGLASSMGWYIYAVAGCEVVLCALAFGRFRVKTAAIGTLLFGLLDLYGMHWLAIPYYTGVIAHQASGGLMALHLSRIREFGFFTMFERLAENKWALLSEPVLIGLWLLYLAGTLMPVAVALALSPPRPSR